MEDVETTALVKARLQGWIDYIGEQADVPPRADATQNDQLNRGEPDAPTYALVGELVDDGPHPRIPVVARFGESAREDAVPKDVVDRVIDQWQKQTDALRTAVEFERERARRIQEAMEREQARQADGRHPPGPAPEFPPGGFQPPPYMYEESRFRSMLRWVALILVCGGAGALYYVLMNVR